MAKIGRLDQRITFQENTRTADGIGGFTTALGNIATNPTVWAQVQPKGGAEALTDGRVNAEGVYLFTIRTRTDIHEGLVILWQSETYNIRAVLRRGSKPLYTQIEAVRGVAA